MEGHPEAPPPWLICVDAGGTFTDCVARAPSGEVRRAKVLTSGVVRARAERVGHGGRLRLFLPREVAGWPLVGATLRVVDRTGLRSSDGVAHRIAEQDGDVIGLERPVSIDAAAKWRDAVALVEIGTGEPAPVLGARIVTGTAASALLPACDLRLATTHGTNALLQRRATPVALFVTQGFEDLLLIGDQRRPELFALDIRKPPPVFDCVVSVSERIDAAGSVLAPIEPGLPALRVSAERALTSGVCAAAVALVHSWRNPAHEQRLAEVLRGIGFEHVSCSSELSGRMKLVARAQTAVVNAALSGPVSGLLRKTADALGGRGESIHVMTSAGGLVAAKAYEPKDSLLSGPAAGVAGAAAVARRLGLSRAIAFDMGGTSTDVARIDGELEYTTTHRVGDAELMSPALAIESVAAGGGSICGLARSEEEASADDAARRRVVARPVVGPASAGAAPGPACYGAGGPLTITDVNLLSGRIDPARFGIPVSRELAERALGSVIEHGAWPEGEAARDELLDGFLRIANERMAAAIRQVSVRRGYDPSDYALIAFGGAGPQHACAVAEMLRIREVVVPEDCGLLSAVGLSRAEHQVLMEKQVLSPLEACAGEIARWMTHLAEEGCSRIRKQLGDAGVSTVTHRRMVSLRYAGQEHAIELEWGEGDEAASLRRRFEERCRSIFGHVAVGRGVEVEAVRVLEVLDGTGVRRTGNAAAASTVAPCALSKPTPGVHGSCAPDEEGARPGTMRARFGGEWVDAPVFERSQLMRAETIVGPALIAEARSITVVEPDWACAAATDGSLLLRRGEPTSGRVAARGRVSSAVRTELLTARLVGQAAEMGEALRRTALSTNVKERLDYSCGILDARAQLVVSAPHIPVHLGALGLCVRTMLGVIELKPGDVVVTNHPAFGGSHLPDVTVVAPVHSDTGELLGYVGARAHHAEIGGTRPGSMPPNASRLEEEGVVLPPMHLLRAGERDGSAGWDRIRAALRGAKHPTRAMEENLADLAAQVAAVRMGAAGLIALAAEFGEDGGGKDGALSEAMEAMQARSDAALGAAVERLGPIDTTLETRMDDGAVIRARVRTGEGVGGLGGVGGVEIDFTGTARVHPGNLNAPLAVVQSAVMYVMRVLIGERGGGDCADLPLSDGLLRSVKLTVLEGMLNPVFPSDPALAPAVAGGNVETSQRIANLLIRALGLAAASQGTMNNVLFGDAKRGYYETIAGGAGAGPGFAGASAVHTHMTNTAITDPEVLEHRYPVRLERFEIRRGSGGKGGAGGFDGGDGVRREMVFLEPMSVSVLTQDRVRGAAGMMGGGDGVPGAQWVERADGSVVRLGPVDGVEMNAGDRFFVSRGGGGGGGSAMPDRHAKQVRLTRG